MIIEITRTSQSIRWWFKFTRKLALLPTVDLLVTYLAHHCEDLYHNHQVIVDSKVTLRNLLRKYVHWVLLPILKHTVLQYLLQKLLIMMLLVMMMMIDMINMMVATMMISFYNNNDDDDDNDDVALIFHRIN